MTSRPVKVLIADDHAMFRDGLRLILEGRPDIEVIGEAPGGPEAVRLAVLLEPDVAIIDIAMPELNGIEATEQIRKAVPGCRVLVLSMYASAEHLARAMRAGALGYVAKESAGAEVVAAVRAVAGGRRFLGRKISERMAEAFGPNGVRAGQSSPIEKLSRREREVVQLVVEGSTSAQVAAALGLSPKTIDTYRSRAMNKLGVSDFAGLVRFALRHGITDAE